MVCPGARPFLDCAPFLRCVSGELGKLEIGMGLRRLRSAFNRAGHRSVSRLTLRVSRRSDMLSVSCRQTLPQLTNFELRQGKTIELRVSEFNKFNDGVARPGKTPKGCVNYVLDKAIVSLIMTATRKSTCCALPPPTDQRRVPIKPFVRGNLE
jgi:hypothetical protein